MQHHKFQDFRDTTLVRFTMDDQRGHDRRWFFAALALFFLWVAALGTMAIFSGNKPAERTGSPNHR